MYLDEGTLGRIDCNQPVRPGIGSQAVPVVKHYRLPGLEQLVKVVTSMEYPGRVNVLHQTGASKPDVSCWVDEVDLRHRTLRRMSSA